MHNNYITIKYTLIIESETTYFNTNKYYNECIL